MKFAIGHNRKIGYLFHLPAIVILTVITVFPMFYNIWLSFFNYSLTKPGSKDVFVWFNNYKRVFLDLEFLNTVWVTARFVIIATLFELLLGVAIAFIIHYHGGRFQRFITSLILIPMMIAPLIVGLIYNFILNPQFGLYTFLIKELNLNLSSTPLSSGGSALFFLILTDIWEFTPFITLMTLAGLKTAPIEPYEAALVDGANGFQIFFKITLPFLRPVIAISVLLRGIEVFKEFDKAYILTGGGPGNSTEVMELFVFNQAFTKYNFSYSAAICVVILIFIIFLGLFYWRFFIKER